MTALLAKLEVLIDETILLVRAARKRQELGAGAPAPVELYGPRGTEIRLSPHTPVKLSSTGGR